MFMCILVRVELVREDEASIGLDAKVRGPARQVCCLLVSNMNTHRKQQWMAFVCMLILMRRVWVNTWHMRWSDKRLG
jgi:hypothetical protein